MIFKGSVTNDKTGTGDGVVTKLKGDEKFVICHVKPEEDVVSGKKGHWVLIQTRNDCYGWIRSEFIEKR